MEQKKRNELRDSFIDVILGIILNYFLMIVLVPISINLYFTVLAIFLFIGVIYLCFKIDKELGEKE